MNLHRPKRKRGVILTSEGWQKLQEAKLDSEIQENSGKRYTVEELSERTGLDPGTITKVVAREQGVDKATLKTFLHAFNLELDKSCYSSSNRNQHEDWGEAPCVSVFYGRTEELTLLKQWILKDHCQLVTLLGIGGIGKTSLSIKLTEQIQDSFEYVIWRSLRDIPPVKSILANIIQFLSNGRELETDLPDNVGGRVSRLIDYLRSSRCLLILDNVESILCSGTRAGLYREGYKGYYELFKRVGEATHQSCLLLTTREKPKDLALLEGEVFPVRSIQLNGLKKDEGQKIFEGLSGSETELLSLVKRYTGNPLALKVVARTILNVFDSCVTEFLNQNIVVVEDIRELLEQQFERLSEKEKEIMYWLAINREPISFAELCSDIISPLSPEQLIEFVDSLIRRSLIEKNATFFTLNPLIMEYVTLRLIEQICEEIFAENFVILRYHGLLKNQENDYIKDIQIRKILKPVIDRLLILFRSKINLEKRLDQILTSQQETFELEQSYICGNILNLLCQLQSDLSGRNFSYLTIWQADLRGVNLHNTNFAHANLAKSVFVDVSRSEDLKTLKNTRPYEGMNISNVTGMNKETIVMLKALGAVERYCQINSFFTVPFSGAKSS
jgi:transcriptional regulator with XRE-family HTH domain